MIEIVKLLLTSVVSYAFVLVLFFSRIVNKPTADFVTVVTVCFSIIAYICTAQNILESVSNFWKNKQILITSVLILLFSTYTLSTLQVQNASEKRKEMRRATSIQKNQQYRGKISEIVNTTTLGEAAFDIVDSERSPMLIVKIPVHFSQDILKKTGINEIHTNNLSDFFYIAFYDFGQVLSRGDLNAVPLVEDCKLLNQFLSFQDPRNETHDANVLIVTEKNPTFYFSVYFWGETCNVPALQNAIGKDVYVYVKSYNSDFSSNSVYKKYTIQKFGGL